MIVMTGVSQFVHDHVFEGIFWYHSQPIREIEPVFSAAGTPACLCAGDTQGAKGKPPICRILIDDVGSQPAGLFPVEIGQQSRSLVKPVSLQLEALISSETQSASDLFHKLQFPEIAQVEDLCAIMILLLFFTRTVPDHACFCLLDPVGFLPDKKFDGLLSGPFGNSYDHPAPGLDLDCHRLSLAVFDFIDQFMHPLIIAGERAVTPVLIVPGSLTVDRAGVCTLPTILAGIKYNFKICSTLKNRKSSSSQSPCCCS